MTGLASPRIALCVPAYNAARFLPRLFASVAEQTQPFDELWVYDDASSDDTAHVAASLGARVVRGRHNVGCSGGKNRLLAETTADWVHFHDADDILHPEFVARAKQRLAPDQADVLLFDYEQVDERSGRQMSRSDFSDGAVLRDPTGYFLDRTVNNGGVYRVALLRRCGGFDEDAAVRYNEDRAFHLRLAEAGARFLHEPYIGCRFYFSEGSMSAANQLKCSLADQEITRRYAERHPDQHRDIVSRHSWANAGLLAWHRHWEAADAAVALAVRTGGRVPRVGGLIFRMLCTLNPYWAIRVRERLLRRRWRKA